MQKNRDLYQELGVSSTKEGVHEAIKNLSKGVFPGAFCKILSVPNIFGEDCPYVQVMHSDGAGTKSNVAYLMKMEGYADYLKLFSNLAQDVTVMNIDDMAAVGVCDNIYLSNHIGRNANRISDVDIAAIINGYTEFINLMKQYDINITETGGETADVGSYVTTVGLDAVTTGYVLKDKVIDCSNIKPKCVIVGLSSYGKCIYEDKYNSGIRSNGLTLAINCMLSPKYRAYKEAWDSSLDEKKVFRGPYELDDILVGTELTIGEALLSPTRTYTPIVKDIIYNNMSILGIIHCSGGGATKSIKFGKGIRYVKEDIIDIPPLFDAIRQTEDINLRNMFQTFNMGTGMEIITRTEEEAKTIIKIAEKYNVYAKIIGYTEKSTFGDVNEVVIKTRGKTLHY